MDGLAVVVLSLDKYSDLWDTFFSCYHRFCKISLATYLVCNELKPNYTGVEIINTGPEISWSSRARKAVNVIKEDYLLVMLEDYFLVSDITEEVMRPVFEYIITQNVDYLRLIPMPMVKYSDVGVNGIHKLREDTLYGVNLQPAVWKKSFLLDLLGIDDISAWEFEARQKNFAPTKVNGNLYSVDYYPFKIVNGVLQGKWYPPSIKNLREKGIIVDTSKRISLRHYQVIHLIIKLALRRVIGSNLIRITKPFLKKIGIKFVTD